MKKIIFSAKSSFFLKIRKNHKGFTIPELIVVMSVFMILTGLITTNLVNLNRSTTLNSVITTLISDLKQQQIKAMTGDTEGRTQNDKYGVHFESTGYILFHGASYNSSDNSNFTVNLDNSMEFSNILFPSGNIIFEKGSGKIAGFVSGSDSVSIRNIETKTGKTIKINKYGVITEVN